MVLRREAIPVLMYSRLDTSRPAPDGLGRCFPWITPARFRRHMTILGRLGFRTLTFEEACRRVFERQAIPRRAVVLTFEGGDRSFYIHARPVLKKSRFTATIFLAAGAAATGRSGSTTNGAPSTEALSPFMIKEIAASGVEFGTHGTAYQPLTSMDHDAAWRDLGQARAALSKLAGRPPATLAYPFGLYNRQVVRLVLERGFIGACSVRPGVDGPGVGMLTEEESFTFRRHPMTYRTGLLRLLCILAGYGPLLDLGRRRFSGKP